VKLHTETIGRGADLFLVHGWCLHSGIWDSVLPELTLNYRVTRVDLPGHGLSREVPMPTTLPALAQLLVEAAPQYAIWLGWSLGGLACLQACVDFPERLRLLVLVSTTPRFITAADWSQALPLEQLQAMVDELRLYYHKTVQRFLALQVQGSATAHANLRQLRKVFLASREPSSSNLERGLVLLRDSDVRTYLPNIHIPTLIITGGYDRLIPEKAAGFMAATIKGARHRILPKASHAPFLSSPMEFMRVLKEFLQKFPVATSGHTNDGPQVAADRA
jgi:pimeloyl-[acyl-carrier protein] methyl ester esterase